MPCTLSRTVSALVLALAAGIGPAIPGHAAGATLPHSPSSFAGLDSRHAAAVRAIGQLRQVRDQLQLGEHSEFKPHRVSRNAEGRTIVRAHQFHEDLRVWAGGAIVHLETDGTSRILPRGLKTGIVLASTTAKLAPETAREIALRSLAAKGPLGAVPKVELVVFPTQFTGGLTTRFDARRGTTVIDRELSTWAKTPAEPYVLAYEVKTLLANRQDGHKEINFIIDANNGAVLRKWNAIQSDRPADGTGTSFFRGNVPLSTAQADDGTYTLQALDRGVLPQPYAAAQGVTQVGLATYYGYADLNTGMIGFQPYLGRATNAWGDGTVIPPAWDFDNGGILLDYSADGTMAWLKGAQTTAGETTAVDAHYGLSASWDFYKNVFQRDGIDDLGTSTFAIVHVLENGWFGPSPLFDNAMWSPWYFGMVFGDGTAPWRNDPGSMKALTEIDITGHELTHGVTEATAALIYQGQSGGLNEATSDILGKMVQAYTDGGATGATIPNFPAGVLSKWEIAHNSGANGGLRFMHKPSLDQNSADCWYDGVELLDVHFSSGPVNRFFYFLCEGASSQASSATYSPYLPSGMAGIGNQKAARIWYKTLTEHLPADADFETARELSITAAQELFGSGSTEEIAVQKAWSAVNVGLAPGQAPRVRVSFPEVHPAGSFLDQNVVPSGLFRKVQLFPTRSNVIIRCNVTNTTNTKVTFSTPVWSANGASDAGVIQPDGSWTTPSFNFYYDLLDVTARSQADPNQFAVSRVLLVPADADTDNETDALDMGAAAMSWGLKNTPNPAAWVAGSGNDWDIAFLGEALANACPVK